MKHTAAITPASSTTVTEASSSFVDFLIAELRCASLRSRLLTAEIDSVAVALCGNFITADDATEWLAEIGALGLIAVSSTVGSTQ